MGVEGRLHRVVCLVVCGHHGLDHVERARSGLEVCYVGDRGIVGGVLELFEMWQRHESGRRFASTGQVGDLPGLDRGERPVEGGLAGGQLVRMGTHSYKISRLLPVLGTRRGGG